MKCRQVIEGKLLWDLPFPGSMNMLKNTELIISPIAGPSGRMADRIPNKQWENFTLKLPWKLHIYNNSYMLPKQTCSVLVLKILFVALLKKVTD